MSADVSRWRVAHHPARHPFVDHLGTDPVDVDIWNVEQLAAVGIDVVHLHFGFEHVSPGELETWAAELAAHHIALVHTVHDLDNPHLVDQAPHRARLRVLAAACGELITLTDWAAEQIQQQHGRRASVIEHPPIVAAGPRERLRRSPTPRSGVYVHGATLRPNLDLDVVEALAPAAPRWGGITVHVRAGAATSSATAARLARLADAGADVTSDPRLSNDELWQRLRSARVVLLPYRWGTHSGLLEAATDLGTPVVAPDHGGYGEQGAITYGPGGAADALDRAIAAAEFEEAEVRGKRAVLRLVQAG